VGRICTVSCFSKIQIGFTFLVPAHPGCPGQRAVKRVCVCVCVSCQVDKCRVDAQTNLAGVVSTLRRFLGIDLVDEDNQAAAAAGTARSRSLSPRRRSEARSRSRSPPPVKGHCDTVLTSL